MRKKESNKLDQILVNKIIRVAYGDAGITEWFYVRFRALTNNGINSLLEEYKKTASAVKNLKQEDVPGHIIERVDNYTNSYNQRKPIISVISFGLFTFWNKKAVPATVLGIILVLIVSFFVFRAPGSTHKYSKAQIELAEKQFRQSMVIVGEAFQNAEKSFSDEVLNKQVNKNLNRGYYLVNNILTGG